jgi:general secretion pathway protein J
MRQHGFTLIEMLTAVAIFAIIGLVAYASLDALLKQQSDLQQAADRFSQLQSAMLILKQDIQQATARPVRYEYGDESPAMVFNDVSRQYGTLLLSLTRTGYSLPAPQSHSRLTRISYRLQEGKLQRLVWPVLDRAQDSKPRIQVLLHDVHDLQFRPVVTETSPAAEPGLLKTPLEQVPAGIELAIDVDGIGSIRRLVQVSG